MRKKNNINEAQWAKKVAKGLGKTAAAAALGTAALYGCDKEMAKQDALKHSTANNNTEQRYQEFCNQHNLDPNDQSSLDTYNDWRVEENKQRKNKLTITEAQLHTIILNTVKQYLKEDVLPQEELPMQQEPIANKKLQKVYDRIMKFVNKVNDQLVYDTDTTWQQPYTVHYDVKLTKNAKAIIVTITSNYQSYHNLGGRKIEGKQSKERYIVSLTPKGKENLDYVIYTLKHQKPIA